MLGELAQLCCVHEDEKTYWVMIEGDPTPEKLARLEQGVQLKDYLTLPSKARILPDPNLPSRSKPVTPHGPTAWIEIKLREGKKRQIRHMLPRWGCQPCAWSAWRLVASAWGTFHPGSGAT